MKREKFLWPLSQSHHRALMMAKIIRESLTSGATPERAAELKQLVGDLFAEELTQHFWDEERLLTLFESKVGPGEPEPIRLRREHRLLEKLAAQGDVESLRQFAELLTAHVRFEEDLVFPRLERAFDEYTRKTAGDMLVHPEKPKDCHV